MSEVEETFVKEENETENIVEALSSSKAWREQRIAGLAGSDYAGFDKIYTQKPLDFFANMEFVRIVSKAIKEAIKGEDGLRVTDVMGVQDMQSINQIDVFLKAIVNLGMTTDDLIKEIMLISMNVPRYERELVSAIMDQPWDENNGTGGISNDSGLEILTTFVDQNAQVLIDFFQKGIWKIIQKAMDEFNQAQESSKPSKPSRRTTPKR